MPVFFSRYYIIQLIWCASFSSKYYFLIDFRPWTVGKVTIKFLHYIQNSLTKPKAFFYLLLKSNTARIGMEKNFKHHMTTPSVCFKFFKVFCLLHLKYINPRILFTIVLSVKKLRTKIRIVRVQNIGKFHVN